MTRMTSAEQAHYVPPPCPKCGSRNVEVHWQDCTYQQDTVRHYMITMFECLDCGPDGCDTPGENVTGT